MKDLWSFLLVVALWLAASVALWWLHRQGLARKRRRQRQLVAQIWSKVRAAQAVYDTIRYDADDGNAIPETAKDGAGFAANINDEAHADAAAMLRARTTMLLRRVQEAGPYFDSVRALHPELQRLLEIENCPPLAEILQIRRDLWAASEIILIDDVTTLGDAFAEPSSYERFCEEATRLLFKGQAETAGEDDLIDLRLSVARTDVEAFSGGVEEDIRAAEERERFPTLAEVISYPVAAARALPGHARTFRVYAADSIDHIRLAARNLRESRTVAEALTELRRAREEFPGLVNASMEKAAALARNGRESIVAHQHLLAKAYDLQAKYQEVLQRAPELTDRGRQFIARLELTKRSEQLRDTSKGMLNDARRLSVRGLAHLIAGLQGLQEWLAVREHLPATIKAASQEILPPQKPAAAFTRPASTFKQGRFADEASKASAAKPIFADFESSAAKPPLAKLQAKPENISQKVETQPVNEQPSPETLNRLDALFNRRPSTKPRQRETGKDNGATPQLRIPKPDRPISTVQTADASQQKPTAADPATQASASVRRLWPALDKLRAAQETPVSNPAKGLRDDPKVAFTSPSADKTPAPTTPARTPSSQRTPSSESMKENSSGEAKKSLFGRKKVRDIEVIPPVKLRKSRNGGEASGDLSRVQDKGSIAEMLARLRQADAELLEAEAFGGPRPAASKTSSLLSKLSAAGSSQFDDGGVIVIDKAPARTQKLSEPPPVAAETEAVLPDAKKSRRFGFLRRT